MRLLAGTLAITLAAFACSSSPRVCARVSATSDDPAGLAVDAGWDELDAARVASVTPDRRTDTDRPRGPSDATGEEPSEEDDLDEAEDDVDGDEGELLALIRHDPLLAGLHASEISWHRCVERLVLDHAPSDLIRPPIAA